jgi:glycerate 2-kinase
MVNLDQARDDVLSIFQHVLRAVDPERLVRNSIAITDDVLLVNGERIELLGGQIVLLGVGKSSIPMARGLEAVLDDHLDRGIIVTKRGLAGSDMGLRKTDVLESSHPVPDQTSVDAGERLLSEASRLNERDLAIVLVSGGGSSLVEAPIDGISLDDLRTTTSLLLHAGADIWTLNAVRRRLSRIKAGGLARAVAPARIVNLILSDVLGSPVDVIASGLSVESQGDDAPSLDWLRSNQIWKELPDSVRQRLEMTIHLQGQRELNVVKTEVVGDADLAARSALEAAVDRGYRPFLLGTRFAGDAREFGRFWGQTAKAAATGSTSIELPACLVATGEMTVNVRGDGEGGRNTEMAASAAFEIEGETEVAVASLATDGDDGSSQAAGGVVVGETTRELVRRGLDPRRYLKLNDTGAFLKASGGLIVTGQTGTNVNDLYLALVGNRAQLSH